MKRIVSVFAVLMMVAGMATAAPSLNGSNGLLRIVAADNNGPMTFGVGVHGIIWMKDSTASSPYKVNMYTIVPSLNFAFSDMFELSVAPVYNMVNVKYGVVDTSDNYLMDTRAALKFSYKASDMFCLGVYAGYDIPTTGEDYKPATDRMGAIHALVIPEFNFGAAKLGLNLGLDYNLDKDSVGTTTESVYPNMAVPFGLGFSYKANDMFMPFLEVSGMYVMDTLKYGNPYDSTLTNERGVMNNPLWITPGVRVSFPFGLNIDAAFDYNLQTKDSTLGWLDRYQDWQIIAGLSYAPAKASGPKVPPTGIISGKVVDKAGKGLAAMVMAGGITANTDPATGAYTLSGVLIDKAPVEIKADAKGYIAKQASIMLTKKNKKTPAMQDFTLDLKPIPVGTAKGLIKDALTGAVIEGSVAFAGPKAETAKTAAGAYAAKLQIGNYNATTNVAGYINKKAAISIAENGTAMNDFVLYQNGAILPVSVVWTSAIRYTTKSIDVANIVAALNDNPNAKITVKAYVDAVSGTVTKQKLADKRADAVKAAIIKAGIAADKIMTEGIVVAPKGNTAALRNANTKVEAVISE
jgi:hypothetical protein